MMPWLPTANSSSATHEGLMSVQGCCFAKLGAPLPIAAKATAALERHEGYHVSLCVPKGMGTVSFNSHNTPKGYFQPRKPMF